MTGVAVAYEMTLEVRGQVGLSWNLRFFDPENQEVRKAVDLAVLQIKNLEKVK